LKEHQLASKWLLIATDDLEMAEIALEKSKLLHAAFCAQQCSEKTLKGIFVCSGLGQPPYTHDLVRLADAIVDVKKFNEQDIFFFSSLNPFYIRARYPDYKKMMQETLNPKMVQEFIDRAREVLKCLQDLVSEAANK
jgi:HEPN domain-containing protein